MSGVGGFGSGAGTGGVSGAGRGAGGGAGAGGVSGTDGGVGGLGGTGDAIVGCVSTPAADSLIADFSGAAGGVAVSPMGTAFTYGAPAPTHVVVAGGWHITLTSPGAVHAQYFGVGFTLNGDPEGTHCLDASAYTGIRFTVSGTLAGSCIFGYAATDSQHENASVDPRGTGDATAYGPQAGLPSPPASPATILMPFSGAGAPAGGNPAVPIDKTKLTRVQWQFTVPAASSCAVDIVIDDVTFY